MISRSQFLNLSLLFCIKGLFAENVKGQINERKPTLFSAGYNNGEGFLLKAFSIYGLELYSKNLPTRGHSISINPKTLEGAIITRSPGESIIIFDRFSGGTIKKIINTNGFHYYGHGFYSDDGRWLYTSENEYNSGRGMVGIYDSKDSYKLVKRISSNGIEPHEISFLKNTKIGVIANGGILTHPDSGKTKLNIQNMESNLTYLNLITGESLSIKKLSPELKLMSIRHIDVSEKNQVAFAMQYQGSLNDVYPLVGISDIYSEIQLFDTPKEILYRMNNYCGSICFDSSGDLLAVSNPRGNIITFWNVTKKCYHSFFEIKDGCGLSPGLAPNSFFISNSYGDLINYWPITKEKIYVVYSSDFFNFDNHLKLVFI